MVPKNMSLRLRLNLLITALSLAFMLAAGWVIVNDAKVSISERVEAASRVTVQLLDNVIVTSVMNPSLGETTDVLNVFCDHLDTCAVIKSHYMIRAAIYFMSLQSLPINPMCIRLNGL